MTKPYSTMKEIDTLEYKLYKTAGKILEETNVILVQLRTPALFNQRTVLFRGNTNPNFSWMVQRSEMYSKDLTLICSVNKNNTQTHYKVSFQLSKISVSSYDWQDWIVEYQAGHSRSIIQIIDEFKPILLDILQDILASTEEFDITNESTTEYFQAYNWFQDVSRGVQIC